MGDTKERPTSKNDAGVHEPFRVDDVPMETFSKGERFAIAYRQLGEYGGGSHIGVCMDYWEGEDV